MRTPPAGVRRGLPRVAGGRPWPESGPAPDGTLASAGTHRAALDAPARPAPVRALPADDLRKASTPDAPASGSPAIRPVRRGLARPSDNRTVSNRSRPAREDTAASLEPRLGAGGVRPPLAAVRTAWPGRAALEYAQRRSLPVASDPARREGQRPRAPLSTRAQRVAAGLAGAVVLATLAAMTVAAARWLLSLPALQDFLIAYPGHYPLPAHAPTGIPAWMGWQHFFNVFMMVLVVRSGLQLRFDARPTLFWSRRGRENDRISLALWLHLSLDLLWLINGAVFVAVLFVTGQWMRIVPTSWSVFPNALSTFAQYVSLDWPTENGWVNYNSLQQLAYFVTVFVAAPLAVATGIRMTRLWPTRSARLNRLYPIEWARRVHFLVMLYFVVFTVVHVGLVLATGALRNLNHMYAALGDEGGARYASDGTGLAVFALSVLVIAGGWAAIRSLTVAPVARLFGVVCGR